MKEKYEETEKLKSSQIGEEKAVEKAEENPALLSLTVEESGELKSTAMRTGIPSLKKTDEPLPTCLDDSFLICLHAILSFFFFFSKYSHIYPNTTLNINPRVFAKWHTSVKTHPCLSK